jgi:violaxanthin de-epoxidase
VPKDETLVQKFSTEALEGDWYISAGLNKAFDIFDCQLHKFTAPSPQKLVGNLQWRIKDPVAATSFVTRYTVQEFEMDKTRQGILYNHDNEFLHYEDDWYILAAKDQKYVVVYYRGNNDAWDGYGGAVVYTKAPAFPMEYVPEVREAVEKVGLKWEDFVLTDNTCKERESKLQEFEQDLVFVESRAGASLQLQGNRIIKEVAKDVVIIEKEIVKDVTAVEKEIVKDVVGLEKEIVKDLGQVEQEVEKDVKGLFGFSKK